jgi:hypothetical protein
MGSLFSLTRSELMFRKAVSRRWVALIDLELRELADDMAEVI